MEELQKIERKRSTRTPRQERYLELVEQEKVFTSKGQSLICLTSNEVFPLGMAKALGVLPLCSNPKDLMAAVKKY